MKQRGLQLLATPRVSSGFKIFEYPRARQFETLAFGLQPDLFSAQRSLPSRRSSRRCLLLLRLDVFAFPSAGHNSILHSMVSDTLD